MKPKINNYFIVIIILLFIINNSIWLFFIITPNENSDYDLDKFNSIIQNCGTLHLPIKQIKKEILIYGDTNRYNELYFNLDCLGQHDFKLFWSLIMANKYNYNGAYFDVFESIALSNCYENFSNGTNPPFTKVSVDSIEYFSLDHIDKKTRDFALNYLVEASERNVKAAKYYLGTYYLIGVYFPQNIDLGKKLIEESK